MIGEDLREKCSSVRETDTAHPCREVLTGRPPGAVLEATGPRGCPRCRCTMGYIAVEMSYALPLLLDFGFTSLQSLTVSSSTTSTSPPSTIHRSPSTTSRRLHRSSIHCPSSHRPHLPQISAPISHPVAHLTSSEVPDNPKVWYIRMSISSSCSFVAHPTC
jgi:hypothetical protein